MKVMFQEFFFERSFFNEFYIYNIGKEICKSNHSYGPNSRENYILHFIEEGSGTFRVEGINYKLQKGDFFLVRPGIVSYYEADPQDPWSYYWLGFNGTSTDEILKYIEIDDDIHVGRIKEFNILLGQFEKLFKGKILTKVNKLVIQKYLLELLGMIQLEEAEVNYKKEAERRYSYSFITYIKHYYRKPDLKIADIAASFGLNNSYFSQVIKREMGLTPNEYLTYFRMRESGTMLMKSDKSVKEIAYSVGYDNPLTFSRAFKNAHGVSPLGYRKIFRQPSQE